MLMFLLGAACASVVWFFVWRNNKEKFNKILGDLDQKVNEVEDKDIGNVVKDLLNKIKK